MDTEQQRQRKAELKARMLEKARDRYSDRNRCGEPTHGGGTCNRSLGHGGGHTQSGKVTTRG